MLNNPTVEKLKSLKLKVMAEMFSDPNVHLRELSFEDRLGLMVEREWLSKKNARIGRLLRQATLGMDACIEDIDYTVDRTIDKKTIQTLATCAFIEQKLNVVISGKTGSGKSYIACAIGNSACRQGYPAKYFRMPELLLEIQEAKQENRYSRYMSSLQNIKLLILDDIGLKAYSLEESRDILEIAESRYNKGSMVLSGQVSHTLWYDLFPDPTIADAIMDRVIHNAYILPLDSKISMREVTAKKMIKDLSS
ncbi:IS21-like element helper ATPase IstB [Dehalobacter sp. DCM]|uniref:IS21-like element helper ATPase IstB n=1 Tax=Dehalobacter sp. DCM TaxID=2907827 RepID=UPI0030812112|nr:IS21-like element helper ATPase IstB [Dehalobacter sp. DCM]UWG97765.1 IS21-like element helper ATPase IstB [Dehalobacter sp. DCM]